MAKPADFYVGVVDIFSILLPGAVVTWTAWLWFDDPKLLAKLRLEDGTAAWVAFVLASYAAGHLVFMLASLVVDASFDKFRDRVLVNMQVPGRQAQERNARDAATALRGVSLGISPKISKTPEQLEIWARYILKMEGKIPDTPVPINTYQWSRAVLRLLAPSALAEVTRLEADSKFFRSLFVVFALLAICSVAHLPGYDRLPISVPAMLLLAALSYWRYAEQRHKGIVEAYRSVVVLFSMGGKAAASPAAKAAGTDE